MKHSPGERTARLAKKDQPDQSTEAVLARIREQLDMLDDRLDNVDSIVSAVAERVMRQPITLNLTCSKCGQKIEIALIGMEKPTR
jgi:hypothetical protein